MWFVLNRTIKAQNIQSYLGPDFWAIRYSRPCQHYPKTLYWPELPALSKTLIIEVTLLRKKILNFVWTTREFLFPFLLLLVIIKSTDVDFTGWIQPCMTTGQWAGQRQKVTVERERPSINSSNLFIYYFVWRNFGFNYFLNGVLPMFRCPFLKSQFRNAFSH